MYEHIKEHYPEIYASIEEFGDELSLLERELCEALEILIKREINSIVILDTALAENEKLKEGLDKALDAIDAWMPANESFSLED